MFPRNELSTLGMEVPYIHSVKSSQILVILGTRNRIFGSLRRDKLKITEYSFFLLKVTTRLNPNPMPNGPGTGLAAKQQQQQKDAEHRSARMMDLYGTLQKRFLGGCHTREGLQGLFAIVICHTCISNYSICKQIIDDSFFFFFFFFESDL